MYFCDLFSIKTGAYVIQRRISWPATQKADFNLINVGKDGFHFKATVTVKPEVEISNYKGYKYCVYEVCIGDCEGNRGKYYKVVTYTQFKFPIIESVITMPVRGETKILGKSYNY